VSIQESIQDIHKNEIDSIFSNLVKFVVTKVLTGQTSANKIRELLSVYRSVGPENTNETIANKIIYIDNVISNITNTETDYVKRNMAANQDKDTNMLNNKT
jgi:hypothetical protein